jgi:hypothetical protein
METIAQSSRDRGQPPDPVACTKALELTVDSVPGAWREAQSVLRTMAHEGMHPAAHHLALAANAFAGERNDLAASVRDGLLLGGMRAVHLSAATESPPQLKLLSSAGEDADGADAPYAALTCSLILRSCRKSNDVVGALAAWECMQAESLWPTVRGLHHLLVTLSRAGKWREALGALRVAELPRPSGGGLATDVRQWNAVLTACVRAGALREAEAILSALPDDAAASNSARAADAISYNTVLHGYAADWAGGESRAARAARAEELVGRMDSAGIARDSFTYSALVDVHQHEPQRVLELLSHAESRGTMCDLRVFSKASRTLWWSGMVKEASQVRERMERVGVEPDAAFFAQASLAAQSVGLFDEADRIHREAEALGLTTPPSGQARARP